MNQSTPKVAPTHVVGIGASAGGLEALTEFFAHVPPDTGMAFLAVLHFDPKHESLSSQILAPVTTMPIHEAVDGEPVEANHIYVIPPGYSMRYRNGRIALTPLEGTRQRVVDILLESIADELLANAVAVILSGAGSDGSNGMTAVWRAGGMTFVQDPATAKFDGMPKSAIATGFAAATLPPAEIGSALGVTATSPADAPTDRERAGDAAWREQLFTMLLREKHVDFSNYKTSTLMRRIQRRIQLLHVESPQAYVKYCEGHPDEIAALFSEMLITLTRFFRDPESFAALRTNVLLPLVKSKPKGAPFRIWSAGCSTGEEVYSIAMSLAECLGDNAGAAWVQIFGTDVNEESLRRARSGEYPSSIENEVSPERLERFFRRTPSGYQVVPSLREWCVFSRHDVTRDPPFAKIDLVTCRNLLIYFSAQLQQSIFPLFHFALNSGGYLWLGKAENISASATPSLFKITDPAHRVFVRVEGKSPLRAHGFGQSTYLREITTPPTMAPMQLGGSAKLAPSIQRDVERMVLERYSPPGVVINEQYDIVYYIGKTAPFLQQPTGAATNNLLRLAHPEYVAGLRQAVEAVKKGSPPPEQHFYMGETAPETRFRITVIPLEGAGTGHFFTVLFTEVERVVQVRQDFEKQSPTDNSISSAAWMADLQAARAYQQRLILEYAKAQEALLISNEEFQSANEELQSTIEELETAKEELQSTSEELTILNDEVQARNTQLSNVNNDLVNLLESVEVPIIMVDLDRTIRRFTPKATSLINIKSADIGRPITDLTSNLGIDNLDALIARTIQSLQPLQMEVRDSRGRWYQLQIRAYKTLDNKIDGAVVSLFDIDALKRMLTEVKDAERAKDVFLANLSHEIRTPLTAILSWAEMLRDGRLDADAAQRATEIILSSAKSQARLIEDMLDVSRIVAGKIALKAERIEPEAVIEEVFQSVKPTADAAAITLRLIAHDGGQIFADPARLRQILANLVNNALKFSPLNTTVTVETKYLTDDQGDWCEISVVDQGIGLSTEYLPHAFEQFSQADASATRSRGGLGLGLAIVKGLTELHGGSVRVESTKGKGTTFRVRLPAISSIPGEKPTLLGQTLARPALLTASLQGMDVLLVEDDLSTREVLVAMLEMHEASVRSAGTAEDGFKALLAKRPDIIISDIGMPGEDGYSLIRRVRAYEREHGGHVPAIALTAFADQETARKANEAGYEMHLAKPIELKHFVASIKIVVAGKAPSNR